MSLETILENALTNPTYLAIWTVFVVTSLAVLVWDLWTNNAAIGSLMKFAWGFTVLYSGPLGLAGYWYSGPTQIPHDSLWWRCFRSVGHRLRWS